MKLLRAIAKDVESHAQDATDAPMEADAKLISEGKRELVSIIERLVKSVFRLQGIDAGAADSEDELFANKPHIKKHRYGTRHGFCIDLTAANRQPAIRGP